MYAKSLDKQFLPFKGHESHCSDSDIFKNSERLLFSVRLDLFLV